MDLNTMILVIKRICYINTMLACYVIIILIVFISEIGNIPPLYLKMFHRSDYRNFCLNFVHNSFCLFKKALPLRG